MTKIVLIKMPGADASAAEDLRENIRGLLFYRDFDFVERNAPRPDDLRNLSKVRELIQQSLLEDDIEGLAMLFPLLKGLELREVDSVFGAATSSWMAFGACPDGLKNAPAVGMRALHLGYLIYGIQNQSSENRPIL